MVITGSNFHTSLIFPGRVEPLYGILPKGQAKSLACKYYTRVEMKDSYKHSSLLKLVRKSVMLQASDQFSFPIK
jgi:hypothetical protein